MTKTDKGEPIDAAIRALSKRIENASLDELPKLIEALERLHNLGKPAPLPIVVDRPYRPWWQGKPCLGLTAGDPPQPYETTITWNGVGTG